MVRPTGFEPVTFGVGDRYSIQLNYGRLKPGSISEIPHATIAGSYINH